MLNGIWMTSVDSLSRARDILAVNTYSMALLYLSELIYVFKHQMSTPSL